MNRIFRLFLMIALGAAAAAGQTSVSSPSESTPSNAQPNQSSPRKIDRSASYYHYALAHMYEEQVTVYGRSDLASKAIQEYRLAIEADPSSEFLTSALAELYVKTGRIEEAKHLVTNGIAHSGQYSHFYQDMLYAIPALAQTNQSDSTAPSGD